MEVEIRREREIEFGEIRELVREAFLTAENAEGDEHDFVERQRQGGGYIPELALVAKCDARLAGHILLTQIFIEAYAQQLPILLLAELSVSLPLRRRGIASALIDRACAEARRLGFQAVILVGDPDFYGRFGFRSSREFGLFNTNGIDPKYVLSYELVPGAAKTLSGTVHLPQ
jgi:predicted N-acetyltransferase YhbS